MYLNEAQVESFLIQNSIRNSEFLSYSANDASLGYQIFIY